MFTLNECPYYPLTCHDIIKWKPIEKNTVDFIISGVLNCEFSEHIYIMNSSNKCSIIFFGYLFFANNDENEKFRAQWKTCKMMGQSYPVVECYFDTHFETEDLILYNYIAKSMQKQKDMKAITKEEKVEILKMIGSTSSFRGGWRIMKYRTDKSTANSMKVAKNVLKSITDGVSESDLIECCKSITFVENSSINVQENIEESSESENEKILNDDEIDDHENLNPLMEVAKKTNQTEDIFGFAQPSKKKKIE